MRSYQFSSFGDFSCANCGAHVSSMQALSGVNNRNHCPYCLWSCHLDLYSAGDRLSACRAKMKPIGLTIKRSRNKYQSSPRGELMLIHECAGCKALSINRIAADDDPEMVLTIFQYSLTHNYQLLYEQHGIATLNAEHLDLVHAQLYGRSSVSV